MLGLIMTLMFGSVVLNQVRIHHDAITLLHEATTATNISQHEMTPMILSSEQMFMRKYGTDKLYFGTKKVSG